MKLQQMTAGILAGGRSSRMGSNKARLRLAGEEKSFLERIASEMGDFSRIVVSVNDKSIYEDLPWELAEDEYKEYGPVEGIYQLLLASGTEYTMIVATDMPFLKKELFTAMASHIPAYETVKGEGEVRHASPSCVVLRKEGKAEPLCSIYGKGCLPALEEMRREDEHRIRKLYERVETWYLNLEDLGFPAELVENINTQEEFLEAHSKQKK